MVASSEILTFRAQLIQSLRLFFVQQGYLEVETPLRLPQIIPERFIESFSTEDCFLQSSPELCMKRLLSRGVGRLFQICKCFRKNEQGRYHLPELTLLEWYAADMDYRGLMDVCEQMMVRVLDDLGRDPKLVWREGVIDLSPPWERMTVAEAFQQYARISLLKACQTDSFEKVLVEQVEPHLGYKKPVFLYDYPAELGSLARLKKGDPKVAERVELYIGGVELANGFSELTDVAEQRSRFEEERQAISRQGRLASPMPEKFLHDLSSMPEAAGIALGVDRLVLLLSGCDHIDQVVAFAPQDL